MFNFDEAAKEINKKHNTSWKKIPGGSGLLSNLPDIDQIYLYTKDPQKQNINC